MVYGVGVFASWIIESDSAILASSDILSKVTGHFLSPEAVIVTIRDFAIPIKEAMLLFIIWDVFLKAKDSDDDNLLPRKQACQKSKDRKRKKR